MNSDLNPMISTHNQDTDVEHMPPNPNAMNPLPTGPHPTDELHRKKANKDTPTQCKLHKQPRSKHPTAFYPPPHSASRRQGKDTAQRHLSLHPQAQQGRHHRASYPQWNP
ncbi:hypothetical protein ILYODFUR_004491 [Ilyodon furcidens]|uniref:Uncharacterized protein n=1 Tax=Ilyodon furcidens TaxID=33524 RepID=A0ABV0V161_9TELE